MGPAVSSWDREAQVGWNVNSTGTLDCSLGKPPMLTLSVLHTSQWGNRTLMCLGFYPCSPICGLNVTKMSIFPQSWNMTCELNSEGTKQKIKRNVSLSISYYKISTQKTQNSSADISMWTFYYHLYWIHPWIQGHHEAASKLPFLSCLFLSYFMKPLLYLVRLPFWTLIISCSFALLHICSCCVSCLEWLL